MKRKKEVKPPGWATKLLLWYCKSELIEDLQGDLNEYFQRNVKSKGLGKAKLNYIIDVFKFFRFYTVRKPEFINLLINWIMIGSYIKTSGRSIVRNKLFSAINIIGLAISMSVGLLLTVFISDLASYDDFHEKKERIYRVTTMDIRAGQQPMTLASTSVKAGKEIQETISGIEGLTIMRNGFGGDAKVGESILPLGGAWASQSFFNVFTFPLLQGNPATALKEPYSLVLTETSAIKLFGTTDALGKTVKFDTVNYAVTGVMKDIPNLSHLRFGVLASFSTADILLPKADPNFLSWESIYSNHVYLAARSGTGVKTLQTSLDRLSKNENRNLSNREITLSLQPFRNIAIGDHHVNEDGLTMVPIVLWILAGLALMVILSACFNYTNLSLARSLRRSREVGIRKVIGALKGDVRGQFITEAVVISMLALVFSVGLFLFLRPQFLSLNPYFEDLVQLRLSPRVILYFISLALIVGLMAGFVPALFFSRINAIQVLKDLSSLKIFRRVTMRKILIVVQYTFSLIFITATVIGYNQYKSFLTVDLGFNTENVLNIDLQGNKSQLFIKELSEIPAISAISRSLFITSLGSFQGTTVKYNNLQDSSSVGINLIDDQYLPLHKHKFIAGGNFKVRPRKGDEREVIVNEQLLKRFDIAKQDPNKALGELLNVDGKKLSIVGVLKDFHYGTIENQIEPVMLRYYSEETGGYLNVKIASGDLSVTMSAIQSAWKKIDNIHPLSAKFYDDQIEEAYSQFLVMTKVIGFLAFLSICIASMGLFGMVVFTTETRLREISIRKVMGASERNLIYLLGKGFLFLLSVAVLIALPVTYLFFDKVLLVYFAYHEPIGLPELFIGSLAVMILAFLMIGSQTLKVARTNPASVLKNE